MCSTWSTDRNIVSRGGGLGSKLHILLTHKLKSKMAHFAFVIKQNKKSISQDTELSSTRLRVTFNRISQVTGLHCNNNVKAYSIQQETITAANNIINQNIIQNNTST